MTDTEAMDAIRLVMSGHEWSADTLDAIALIVQATHRTIESPEER